MNRVLLAAAACATLSCASAASATVLVSDNFDSDTQALNWPGDASFESKGGPDGNASTDLIGNNGPFPLCGGGATNQCVDLDGSTGYGNDPAGKLVTWTKFGSGAYTLTFDLGGNQRGAPAQTTVIKMGHFSDSITLASDAPMTTYTFTFDTGKPAKLKFKELGPSDQQGNLLDNVVLSSGASADLAGAVPEPATWAMMILGIGGIGAMRRRSRGVLATA